MIAAPAERAGVCRGGKAVARACKTARSRPSYREDTMLFRHRTLIAAAAALTLGASATLAQTSGQSKPLTPQQERMAKCSAANKGKTGDAYKSGMSACLKGEEAASTVTPQQQKMKDCNAEANKKALKGDQRKTFMSTCLKG
ncbi:PsiF family protein [Bordetella bronchialis]